MHPRPARKQTASLAETVETYTKLGLPLLGFLYVIGFVVNALYLGKYGISPLSVLRVQYLIAGLWALAPFAVLVGGVAAVSWVFIAAKKDRKLQQLEAEDAELRLGQTPPPDGPFIRRMKSVYRTVRTVLAQLWAVVFLTVIVLFSLQWVAEQFPSSGESLTWNALWHFWPIAAYAFLIGVTTAAVYRSMRKSIVFQTVAFGGLWIVVVVGYLGYFSAKIYPLIPSVFGGGQPVRVQLLLKQSVPGLAMQTPLLTKPYDLLVSSEKTVVILDGRKSTEYSRDLLQAVIVERPEPKQR